MKNTFLFILITAIFSCSPSKYTESDAIRDADKALKAYPEPIHDYYRLLWPCITTADTTSIDSAALNEWKSKVDSIQRHYDSLGAAYVPQPVYIDTSDCLGSISRCQESDARNLAKISLLQEYSSKLKSKLDSVPAIYVTRSRYIADMGQYAAVVDSVGKVIAAKSADYDKLLIEYGDEQERRMQAEANAKVLRKIVWAGALCILLIVLAFIFGNRLKSLFSWIKF